MGGKNSCCPKLSDEKGSRTISCTTGLFATATVIGRDSKVAQISSDAAAAAAVAAAAANDLVIHRMLSFDPSSEFVLLTHSYSESADC